MSRSLSTLRPRDRDGASKDPAAEVARERERLAREIHDGLARELSAIRLIARPGVSAAEARKALGEVAALAERSLARVRHLLTDLRDDATAALGPVLAQDVSPLAARAGAHVRVMADAEMELPPGVRVAVRRIAREAVANALLRGGAAHVEVRLAAGPPALLTIGDDGDGFDPRGPRRPDACGLDWMRAEAEAVGGRLTIESAPGEGTTVTVRLGWGRRP